MPLAISKLISPTSLGNPLCSAVKRQQWPPFEAGLEGGPSPLISPADKLNERGQAKYLSLLLQILGGGRRRRLLLLSSLRQGDSHSYNLNERGQPKYLSLLLQKEEGEEGCLFSLRQGEQSAIHLRRDRT